MQAYTRSVAEVERALSVDKNIGLTDKAYKENKAKFGENILSQKKQKTLFNRVIDALFEPMMIILLFAFAITLGINIARQIKSGDGEFYECIGIFIAIFISVFITVIMEGKSQRAFELLRGLESQGTVKVMRNGKIFGGIVLSTTSINGLKGNAVVQIPYVFEKDTDMIQIIFENNKINIGNSYIYNRTQYMFR